MKTLLESTYVCGVLAVLPIAIFEGMWSYPSLREFARKLDGSAITWIVFSIYVIFLILIWIRWNVRPEPPRQ